MLQSYGTKSIDDDFSLYYWLAELLHSECALGRLSFDSEHPLAKRDRSTYLFEHSAVLREFNVLSAPTSDRIDFFGAIESKRMSVRARRCAIPCRSAL